MIQEKDFRQLYNTYYPQVIRRLLCIVGNKSLAEDLAQETFLKLYSCPPNQMDNLGGWLSKVAANLAYNQIREEKNRTAREIKSDWLKDTKADPTEEIVLRNQKAEFVQKMLQKLEPRDRTCLVLKFTGFSYEEIAEVIGINKTSVGTILARAQAKFKDECLKGENYEK